MIVISPGLDQTQRLIVRPPPTIRVIDHKACRRYGKSHSGKAIIIDRCVAQGQRVLYLTPSASQYGEMYKFFAYESAEMVARHAKRGCAIDPTPHLTFQSGGYFECRSLEVIEGARGGEWDVIIVDEQQDLRCSMEQFTSVVTPMLANRDGLLYFLGQFAGKNEQFQQYFVPGVAPGQLYHDKTLYRPERHLSIRSPWDHALYYQTTAGGLWLAEQKRILLPNVFKQEFECICLDSGSGVFERVDNILGGESHKYPRQGEVYYVFWDAGKESDPSAVVVLAKFAGTVCNAFSLPIGMSYTEQVQWVKAQGQFFRNVCYGVDTTSGGTNSNAIEDFCRPILAGLHGLNFNQYAKEDFVRRAQLEMEQRTVLVPREHDELIAQLRRYTYEKHPVTGRYFYHAPIGEHDDLVAAFIGALHMRAMNWGPTPGGRAFGSMQG